MARMTHTVEVETFGRACTFALTLPHPSTAAQLKEEVRKTLGLKPASLALFALSLGRADQPTCVLDEDAEQPVPTGARTCLHRWTTGLDSARELRLARADDAALHLLYSEARHRLDHHHHRARGGAGLGLDPTPEQAARLEELSDPAFPTERQFLEAAQQVSGYASFRAAGCRLERPLESRGVALAAGASVECAMDAEGLSLRSEEEGEEEEGEARGGGGGRRGGGRRLSWKWMLVKRWSATYSHSVKFELCNSRSKDDSAAPVLEWVSMATPQAYFLAQAATMICTELEARQQAALNPAPGPPGFNPLLPGKPYDPLAEFVNKKLFGSFKFSSIGNSEN